MGPKMQLSDRIGRRIKLHDLHVLMAVVQAGSMSKAAVLLNTGQSAISRSIAELEHTLGVQLLDRSAHGIKPTEYGRAMLKHGGAAFDELKQGVKALEYLADPGAGEVRIGCGPHLADTLVSAVIERLSRRYPRIVFHLVTSNETDALYRDLRDRKVDFLISRKAARFGDDKLRFEILYDPSFVVVAGSRSPWARRRRIVLAELVNEAWVMPPPEGLMGPPFVDVLRAGGLDEPRIVAFAPPGVRLNLVATGRFLTIATNLIFGLSKRPGIKVLPVKLQYEMLPMGVVTLENRTLSPAAQLFIEDVREVAKPLIRRKL